MRLLTTVFWVTLVTAQQSRDYGYYQARADPNVCNKDTCRLPACFCAGKDSPLRMDPSVIPQIVMFTFDDAVNEQVIDYYKELFPKERVNPNGCPVTVTFFVSHNWTDYSMVKSLYDRGHEIASHSITHKMPQSWWRYASAQEWKSEIGGQRDNIVQQAGIPRDAVTGMRAPFLDTGGDAQYSMMEANEFEYDASFMTGPHDNGDAWPFTLDSVPNWQFCTNLNCPQDRHPGVWEVPLNRWVDIDGNGCSMVDSCQKQPGHKGEALAYLWQNFNRNYYGNRAPVGVNMHATWFETDHNYDAMNEFVKTISEMDDVYLITIQQTLAWMKTPQTKDRATSFRPWLKSCSILQQGDLRRRIVASEDQGNIPSDMYETERPWNSNSFNNLPIFNRDESRSNDIAPSTSLYANADGYPEEFYEFNRYSDGNSEIEDDIITSENAGNPRRTDNDGDPMFDTIVPELFKTAPSNAKTSVSQVAQSDTNVNVLDKQISDQYEYYDSDDDDIQKSATPSPTPAKKAPPRQNIRTGLRPPGAQQNNAGRRPRPTRQENQATRQQRLSRSNSAQFALANKGLLSIVCGYVISIQLQFY